MRARSIVPPALFSVLAVVLAACSSTPAAPIANPAAVLKGLPAAESHAGSVRFLEVTTEPGLKSTLAGELSASASGDAEERLIQGKSELDVERVGDVLYLRASAQVLQAALELSTAQAAPYAGRWVSVSPGDLLFPSLSSTLDLTGEMQAYVPKGAVLEVGATRALGHTTVVPISGAPPSSVLQGARGALTLFVAPSPPHLPASASMVLRKGSRTETRIVAFTHWGAPVHLVAPAGAVSYRSIATAPAG